VWAIPQVMGLRLDGSLVLWAHLCIGQGTALQLFLDSGPSLGGLCQQTGPQTPGRALKLFFPLYKELVLFKFEDIAKVEDTF
jgi:hypothetical protein